MSCSLEFSIGPIVLYGTFWAINLATVTCYYLQKSHKDAEPFASTSIYTKREILWTSPTLVDSPNAVHAPSTTVSELQSAPQELSLSEQKRYLKKGFNHGSDAETAISTSRNSRYFGSLTHERSQKQLIHQKEDLVEINLNCVRVALDVSPSITVSELHLQLAEKVGAGAEAMQLMFGDVELDPTRTLNDYLDRSGQTIQLAPKLTPTDGACDEWPNC